MTRLFSREDAATLENTIRQALPEMKLTADMPMSRCTTLRLGGPADLFAEPATAQELQALLRLAQGVPTTVIGQGSNLLVRDGGIRGLVIRIGREMRGVEVHGERIAADAGLSMAALAQAAAENNLSGVAFAAGIPGSVGGGACMNAGAYGGEMCQVIERVECIKMDGTPVVYTAEEMQYGYRTSRLHREDAIITRVHFRLNPGRKEEILAEMAELNRRRAEKQPLTMPSAGSTFKRPTGYYAAALIEECGLKGVSVGGAQVSEKHSGFLINCGGTAADFLALIAHVQQTVLQAKGVQLEPEVRILGEETCAEMV